jgi:hypothetical protein
MPGLCRRAWLLLVLLVALLTWHIRPQHGRVVVGTQPSRGHNIAARTPGALALPRSQPQQHDSAPEPRAAPEQLPEWVVDHDPRTRSLLRLYPHLAAPRSQQQRRSVPGVDELGGCPGNCSGHGQCQPQRGTAGVWSTSCACAPGWNGTVCEVRDASPCNTPHGGGRVLSRCAGRCDEDVNRCYCGEGSRFPARPMPWCYYDGVENDMPWQTPKWSGFAHGPKALTPTRTLTLP